MEDLFAPRGVEWQIGRRRASGGRARRRDQRTSAGRARRSTTPSAIRMEVKFLEGAARRGVSQPGEWDEGADYVMRPSRATRVD